MHKLTLRAVGANAILIDQIIKLTRQKTASGAIFSVLRMYEGNMRDIERLQIERNNAQAELREMKEGIANFTRFNAFLAEFMKPKTKQSQKEKQFFEKRPQSHFQFDDDDFDN